MVRYYHHNALAPHYYDNITYADNLQGNCNLNK